MYFDIHVFISVCALSFSFYKNERIRDNNNNNNNNNNNSNNNCNNNNNNTNNNSILKNACLDLDLNHRFIALCLFVCTSISQVNEELSSVIREVLT